MDRRACPRGRPLFAGSILALIVAAVTLTLCAWTLAFGAGGALPVTALAPSLKPDACNELIANGSFEDGEYYGWETSGSPWLSEQAHHGTRSAGLGESNGFAGQFFQEVTLPAAATSAGLSFWWYMSTYESGMGTPADRLYVEVRSTEGTLLNTLETQSSASSPGAWYQSNTDLTAYPDLLGLTVRIVFRASTDGSLPTTFLVDEVSLQVCTAVTCPWDWKEPNDTIDQAAAIQTAMSYYNLYICPSGDEDWFRLSVAVDDALDVTLFNLPADYDLALYDPHGELVATSLNGGMADERIQWVAGSAGEYRVRVYGAGGAWSATQYAVRVDSAQPPTATPTRTPTRTATPTIPHTVTPTATHSATPTATPSRTPTATATGTRIPTATATASQTPSVTASPSPTATPTRLYPACPDGFEPNNTHAQAWTLPDGPGGYWSYICAAADVDFWRFPVAMNRRIDVTLASLPHDYRLSLYRPDGTLAREDTTAGMTDKKISFVADAEGEWRARVTGYQGAYDVQRLYHIFVDLTGPTPTPGCQNDWQEPNNSEAAAKVVARPYTGFIATGLSICLGDADYFAVQLAAGSTLRATIGFSHAAGDLNMVLRSAGSVIRRSETVRNMEYIEYTSPDDGTYYIAVYPALLLGENRSYDIALQVLKPDFYFDVDPEWVTLDLDPVLAGETDVGMVTTLAQVRIQGGNPGPVTLSARGVPPGVDISFTPERDTVPFVARVTLNTHWPNLAAVGAYNLTIVATAGALVYEETLHLNIDRSLSGDLIVTAAKPVQVVADQGQRAPLVRDKATAFEVTVWSSFPVTVTAWMRLGLAAGQWSAPDSIRPLATSTPGTGNYPADWGPYRIRSGWNTFWLPYVPPGRERDYRDATNPAGIIQGTCWGRDYQNCTVDTRYVPRP